MAAAVDVAAGATSSSASSLTTGSASLAGSDRFAIGVAVATGQDTSSFKYGGSSGTNFTQYGTDYTVYFGSGTMTVWTANPGPSGSSTTFYSAFAAAAPCALAAVNLNGVDQTTPYGTPTVGADSLFSGSTAAATSLTVTGLSSGQKVVGVLGICDAGAKGVTSVTAGANTTIVQSSIDTTAFIQGAHAIIVEGTSSGTSLTFNVTINSTSGGGNLGWKWLGFPITDAAGGGGPTYELAADGGTFSYSGTAAALTAGRTISAEGGTYSLSGADAALTAGRTLSAEGGSYSLSSTDAALTVARTLSAEAGTYTLTGQDVDLTYTPAITYTLAADGASFTYSGGDVAFGRSYVLGADAGGYGYAGADAALTYSGATAPADATGGWFLPVRRKRRKAVEQVADAPPVDIEAEQRRLESARALRRAEAKDRQVVSELRRLYAEQDALTRAISQRKADIARQIEDEEEVALLLSLAS